MQRKSNLLLVSEYYPPHWTGLSQYFYHMARGFSRQGYEVSVLTTQFDIHIPAEETTEDIHIRRVPFQFKLSRTHYSPLLLWRFIHMLPHTKTVIVNSPNSNILFLAILTKLFGKKLYIFHQGDIVMPKQTGNQLVGRLMEILFTTLTLPAVFLADGTACCTRDYAEYSRVLRHRLSVFQAYIPPITFPKRAHSPVFKRNLAALKKKHTLIGIAGRFVEEKGFDLLFEQLPEILIHIPNAHIVFAGQEKMAYEPFFDRHKALIKKHAKHITFLGLLHAGDLAHFYDTLDVFVVASRTDCFPFTQVEALKHNVPIVVTDTPGARMVVKESGCGVVVPQSKLAAGIVTVLKDRPHYVKNNARARQFLKNYETWNIH